MAAFALLFFVKRNDRIRNKLAEITQIKGLSTNYYQVRHFIFSSVVMVKRLFHCLGSLSATHASSTIEQ
jgi:hypothetical protein